MGSSKKDLESRSMNRLYKKIAKALSSIDDVRAVILYGSFARDEATPRSDIDLLILVSDKKATKPVQDAVITLEREIGRVIQPTIRTTKELEQTDSGLLKNIFQEGKILYLKEPADIPSSLLIGQKQQVIYTFQIAKLSQNDKVKFNNEFYGRKKGKYNYNGTLKDLGGQKLSPGCILIPISAKQKVEKYFKRLRIVFESTQIWK
ncbi:MAG: nucleotidyltransferase domain-containing protein [Candidatus Omnitrophica bacterium]|nr:nucleotidyltransferase domain-containing protein [Candidatus Omnitrophota bacterium]